MFKPGSRKSKVYATFVAKGPNAAMKLGLELGLNKYSIATWLGDWKRSTRVRSRKPKAASEQVSSQLYRIAWRVQHLHTDSASLIDYLLAHPDADRIRQEEQAFLRELAVSDRKRGG